MDDRLTALAFEQRLAAAQFEVFADVVQEQVDRRLSRTEGLRRPIKDDLCRSKFG
jgi:hypothetical protein